MSHWSRVEVYSTFLKLTGDLDWPPEVRLSDLVADSDVIELRDPAVEPATEHHLRLNRGEQRLTVVKAAISLLCPRDQVGETARHREAWRRKQRVPVLLNAQAFSMVCDVHLEPGASLDDHLCDRTAFVPVTNLSALWLSGAGEPRAVQRGFALLNCGVLVSFAAAPPG
jgi:hypothetical protein